MRKQVTDQAGTAQAAETDKAVWLDLEALAQVQVSSEAAGHPVESALVAGSSTDCWQAAAPGMATLTLRFDAPQRVQRVLLHVVEPTHERSQEWALTAVFADGASREILRQGWNFSPGGSKEQREVYNFNLNQVASLTLTIDPDRGRDRYPATLAAWRVGLAG